MITIRNVNEERSATLANALAASGHEPNQVTQVTSVLSPCFNSKALLGKRYRFQVACFGNDLQIRDFLPMFGAATILGEIP